MKKNYMAVPGALLICAGLLCSCVSERNSTTPWMVGNLKIGTIQIEKETWGTEWDYRDLNGRLARTEKQDKNGALLPGICTVRYTYNTLGALTMEETMNSAGHLACGSEGYAVIKYSSTFDADNHLVAMETYFDENQRPVLTKSGFAVMWTTKDENGQPMRSQFFDLYGKPAPSTWRGVSGAVDVHYVLLQGMTPVLCGVFFDGSGHIIDRKQLSGQTHTEQETFN